MTTIRKSEKIFEDLMKQKGCCYNENVIDEYIRKWELPGGRMSRGDALYNIGLESDCFTKEEIKKRLSFEIFKNKFDNYNDFEKFYNKLSEELKKKFLRLSSFYYYRCKEPVIYEASDESFKLITMTSIIEALMTDYKYKEFKAWFDTNYSAEIKKGAISGNEDIKSQINKLWENYKKIHGSTRKVKIFFDKFLDKNDKENLMAGFKKLSKKYTKLKEIAEWLYEMRSKFVHGAYAIPLHEERCMVGCVVKGQPLAIRMSISEILSIFERGFIAYFSKSYGEKKDYN